MNREQKTARPRGADRMTLDPDEYISMQEKVEVILQDSLARHIGKWVTFVSGFLFIFLSAAVLVAALAESAWWLAALPVTTTWCGVSFGCYSWLDR